MVKALLRCLIVVAMSTATYARAGFCDPAHTRQIPDVNKTQCSVHLYAIFPKITEYKGQLWEAGPSCLYNGGTSKSDLSVQYCKSGHTRSMDSSGKVLGENLNFTMAILDLEGPEYQSKINQSLLKGVLSIFDERMLSPMMRLHQSNNKNFDKDMARISMPSDNNDAYVFTALHSKRYLIKIIINGKGRFKEPKDVDGFILEYTEKMSFPK